MVVQLQEVVDCCLQAPLRAHRGSASSLEPAEAAVEFVLGEDRLDLDNVTSVIEVKVTPQREGGFDNIAHRISRFPEVKSAYLMSGTYDLLLFVEGRTLREVAGFVSERLSPWSSPSRWSAARRAFDGPDGTRSRTECANCSPHFPIHTPRAFSPPPTAPA